MTIKQRQDSCPKCLVHLGEHAARRIDVAVQGVHESLYYKCPDCDHRWHTWPFRNVWHDVADHWISQATMRANLGEAEARPDDASASPVLLRTGMYPSNE